MVMTMEEALQILGVNSNSTEAEIKTAYKRLALKTHPGNMYDHI
jgi:curved DNA-binding protein CbpA